MWIMLAVLFISYPLPTFMEICADGKGNPPERWTKLFMKDFEGRFIFRIWYYAVMLALTIWLAYCGIIPYISIIIPFYYLMDRIPQLKMKKLAAR